MANKEAQYLYKCRRCGKIDRSTSSGENLAMMQTINIVLCIPTKGIPLSMISTHICKDGGYGVTDFIGVDIIDERKPVNC